MPTLTLGIEPLSDQPGWTGRWSVDGAPAGTPFRVEGEDAATLAAVSQDFLELFESRQRPEVEASALAGLGAALHRLWFAPAWTDLAPRVPASGADLVVASADSSVLDLPWELVEIAPGLSLGCDPGWTLRRLPPLPGGMALDLPPPGAGPLRVLFLAAAPTDQALLDFEKEEDLLLRAAGAEPAVSLHFAESGSFAELEELVDRVRPHVVHLSGHGDVLADGRGVFAFEDEDGRTDLKTADEIVAGIGRGSGVRCLVLNGCKTSQAATAGLCRALAAAGVPLAVGWSASVADDMATHFAEEIYRRLRAGLPVGRAAAHARQKLQKAGARRVNGVPVQDASFALVQVWGCDGRGELFDRRLPPEKTEGPRTVYALLGDGVKGLSEGFVGRRRQIQALLPLLRRGTARMAVLTGLGGAGKSTLATRAANRLASEGFRVVPVRVPEKAGSPAEAGRQTVVKVIDALERAFVQEKREDLRGQLVHPDLRLEQRLQMAVSGLNGVRLVLVLDNFEDVLDLAARRIADPDLALLYRALATDLTDGVRGSRVLVTCRYLPAEGVEVLHVPLPDFPASEVRKFLLRGERVEARLSRGEIPLKLFERLTRELGGTPGFLDAVRALLRRIDPEELLADLEGEAAGALTAEREAYLQRILVARLYGLIPGRARTAVSRLALSELPLPAEAIARLTGNGEEDELTSLLAAAEYGLVQIFPHEDLPDLYHPPGLLRPWLTDPERLPAAEAAEVHREIAAFWKDVFEAGRSSELRAPIDTGLDACRHHARAGGDPATFRWATVLRSWRLNQRSEWRTARLLLGEIAEEERDAGSLIALAQIEGRLGNPPMARDHLDAARLKVEPGSAEEGLLWHEIASLNLNQGDYASAMAHLTKALEIRQGLGDRAGQAVTVHQIASIHYLQGEYGPASKIYQEALRISRELGDRAQQANTLHQIASIYLEQGEHGHAMEIFEKALNIREEIRDRAGQANTLHQIASIHFEQGKHESARKIFEKTLLIRQDLGDRAGQAGSSHQIASIYLEQRKYCEAAPLFQYALRISQELGERDREAARLYQLGHIAVQQGYGPEGAQLIAFCWLIDREIGHGDASNDFAYLTKVCNDLGYDQAQFDALLAEAKAAYAADRGWGLIRKVFGAPPA